MVQVLQKNLSRQRKATQYQAIHSATIPLSMSSFLGTFRSSLEYCRIYQPLFIYNARLCHSTKGNNIAVSKRDNNPPQNLKGKNCTASSLGTSQLTQVQLRHRANPPLDAHHVSSQLISAEISPRAESPSASCFSRRFRRAYSVDGVPAGGSVGGVFCILVDWCADAAGSWPRRPRWRRRWWAADGRGRGGVERGEGGP